jgi:HEAT repeat protein
MDFFRPDSLQSVNAALGSVYRALRAWRFYPKGHPTRKKMIRQAYGDMQMLLGGHNLTLQCGRSGFALPESEPFRDSSGLSASLSYELFIRRVQMITFLGDLYQEDLLDLLRIVTLSPDEIQQAGGVDKLLADHGVRTIWINRLDLSAVLESRRELEARGIVPQGLDELEGDSGIHGPQIVLPERNDPDEPGAEEELQPLLARLAATRDEEIYLGLVRQAVNCAETLISCHQFSPLLPMVELLASQAGNGSLNKTIAEYARFGLGQLAASDELIAFLLDQATGPDAISREALFATLVNAGPSAYAIAVEKMGSSDRLVVRKTMANLLVQVGEPVVASILALLNSQQSWQVVRNQVCILGDIGSPEAVGHLQALLQHSDIRVRKEAIRSLAKIGGRDAETAIIAVLRGNDPLLLPQSITSLGGMRSSKALADLMQILLHEELFLKDLSLKKDVLAAFAMIGERSVVERLLELLQSRHLIARKRWLQLKIAIVNCLGKLGDPQSLPVLQSLASNPGELGRACSDAIDSIERTGD